MEKTEGFVLKNIPFLKASSKIGLFSRKFGKIPVIARGYLKPKTKYFGRLEVPSYVEIMLVRRKRGNDYLLTGLEQLMGFSNFYIDLERFFALNTGIEILDKILPWEEPNELVYKWFKWFVYSLDKKNDTFYLIVFILKFLLISGFYSLEKKCFSCGRNNFSYFSLNRDNEIFCIDCSQSKNELLPIYILDYLRLVNRKNFMKHSSFRGKTEVLKFLIKYVENIVDLKINSYYVMEKTLKSLGKMV